MNNRWKFLLFIVVFVGLWFLPDSFIALLGPVQESFALAKWYAREHVLLCLIPAFFIAGAIAVFINEGSVMKYLGAKANRFVAYTVASVSGSILAVCSCTVLPLFAGIYTRGAGLGPATAFLYAGPAINVLAMVLTAQVLGIEMGIARALGAVLFSVLIGIAMQLLFGREDTIRTEAMIMPQTPAPKRALWQDGLFFALMVGILVFANWGAPHGASDGLWAVIYSLRWWISGGLLLMLGGILWRWFAKDELNSWVAETWQYAAMMIPPLLIGVLATGLLLGRPGHEGIIPSQWIDTMVGGNSLGATLFAAVAGAAMYVATLTEVPILQGLMGAGMGKGPALALLLAGPAVSLPNLLVIRTVLGTKKTIAYCTLVVIMATIAGFAYGTIF